MCVTAKSVPALQTFKIRLPCVNSSFNGETKATVFPTSADAFGLLSNDFGCGRRPCQGSGTVPPSAAGTKQATKPYEISIFFQGVFLLKSAPSVPNAGDGRFAGTHRDCHQDCCQAERLVLADRPPGRFCIGRGACCGRLEPGHRFPGACPRRQLAAAGRISLGQTRPHDGWWGTSRRRHGCCQPGAPGPLEPIDEAILAPIKDNTLGVRRAEKAAHDFILAKARDVPLKELERAARDDVVFAVLMIDSDRFRGKLLTITGELKRLVMLPAAKNDFGLNDLYEAWIANADSGDNLYRVVCTEIPADIPADILADILTGELIEESVPVRTTGYFFKRFGYATVESRLHVAPLILARSLQQISAPPAVTDHHELTGYILTVVAAVVVAVAIMVWCYSVSDKKFQQTQLKRLTNAPSEAIGALTSVETTDVNDLFRTMTEEARAADQTETSRNVTPSRNHDDAAKPQIE